MLGAHGTAAVVGHRWPVYHHKQTFPTSSAPKLWPPYDKGVHSWMPRSTCGALGLAALVSLIVSSRWERQRTDASMSSPTACSPPGTLISTFFCIRHHVDSSLTCVHTCVLTCVCACGWDLIGHPAFKKQQCLRLHVSDLLI